MSGLRRTIVHAVGLAALLGGASWLQLFALDHTPSPNCDEPTAVDLRCAVERDWRTQARARQEGPGVVFDEGCQLARNARWPQWDNERQSEYSLHKVLFAELDPAGTDVRIEAIKSRALLPLAYRDTWVWSAESGWAPASCGWTVGDLRPAYLEWLAELLPPGPIRIIDDAPFRDLLPEPWERRWW